MDLETARKLIRSLGEAVGLLVENVVVADNPTLAIPATVALPVAESRPKLKRLAAPKKTGKRKKAAAPVDDGDEDEDDGPEIEIRRTSNGKSVSCSEAVSRIETYLRKIGRNQAFTSHDLRNLFEGELSSTNYQYAMRKFIDKGVVEITSPGRGKIPVNYRKVAAMEQED